MFRTKLLKSHIFCLAFSPLRVFSFFDESSTSWLVVLAWDPVANQGRSHNQNRRMEVGMAAECRGRIYGFSNRGASAASPRYFFVPVVGLEEGRGEKSADFLLHREEVDIIASWRTIANFL